MKSPRIVSLLASATETACALGFEQALVGRSHECDYPPGVLRLPVCSRPLLDPEAASRIIHEEVRKRADKALSIYALDVDLIRSLEPDILLTQDHCRVCAVSLRDVEEAACAVFPSRPRIFSLQPQDWSGILEGFRNMSGALGHPERGEALAGRLEARLRDVREKAGTLGKKPTVVCLEWLDPPMAAGNWMPELVDFAGGINLLGQAGRHSPWMDFSALESADPDRLLLLPCGFGLERTRRESLALQAHPRWRALRAVRNGEVYLLDGNRYFNRPGPRLEQSLEILAEILHPAAFRFGHEGDGWERL